MSRRSTSMAGGTTMKLKSDITGSCTAITVASPMRESRSRPSAVISRLSTPLAAVAPVVSRGRRRVDQHGERERVGTPLPRGLLHQQAPHQGRGPVGVGKKLLQKGSVHAAPEAKVRLGRLEAEAR